MAGKGGAEGCCANFAKVLLIVFNSIFCLLGIGLIAGGIYAVIKLRDYLNILGNNSGNAVAILIIVFGVITFIIAAIGCLGACKESPCLLFTFAVIIAILLIAEIGVGIAAVVYKDQVEELFIEGSLELMKGYDESDDESAAKEAWDFVQDDLGCCGANSSENWKSDTFSPKQQDYPKSCGDAPTDRPSCDKKVREFIESNLLIIGAVTIAFGLIELLGVVFACCVGCNIKRGD
ncbi:leukocyte surface antigen CD53-like [Watersipora subatra]|uniref:leukocyte surface antigen CD53-like n=1 Tax=Watersipora subatra TaxID=2589382 RepID=UPI00355BF422